VALTFIRSMTIMPGKTSAVLAWAREHHGILSKQHAREPKVMLGVGGEAGRIAWILEFDSLAHYEQVRGKALGDKGYLASIDNANGLFVPGSMDDDLWLSV
jgi:hypothetical protein